MPSYASATEFLSVTEQRDAIAAVQAAHVTDLGDRVVYTDTPEGSTALALLVQRFMPVIEKEARLSKVLDYEDARATLFEEFVATVRLHDLDSKAPFSKTIGTILRRKISDTDRTSDLVVVKESVAAAYWRLIHKHEGDFAAAYEEVKSTDNNLAASTFLAAHNVIGGIESLDPVLRTEDDDNAPRFALAASVASHDVAIAVADEIEWLLSKVTDRQRQILLLAFGFSDIATEKIRLAKGYSIGEVMDDGQVAHALDLSRPTVQRDRVKALDVMRSAFARLAESEWA